MVSGRLGGVGLDARRRSRRAGKSGQAGKAGNRGHGRKPRRQQDRDGRAGAGGRVGKAEDQRDQSRTDRLPQQPRRRLDRAGAAAALARRAGDDGAVVRRLEKPEAEPAHGYAPQDVGGRRVRRQQRQQHIAEAQHAKADAAEDPGRIAVGEPAGDRRDHRHRRRPRRHQQPGRDLRAAEHVLEIKRQGDKGDALRDKGRHRGRYRQREYRAAKQIDRQQRQGQRRLAAHQDVADAEARPASSAATNRAA